MKGLAAFLSRTFVRIAVVLALVIFLIGGGYLPLPFPPFETYGTIYVGSPEVYTRERLVNDRYDQDFWYRTQLGKLDESDSLLTAYLETATHLGIKGVGASDPLPPEGGSPASSNSPSTENSGAGDASPNTPFDQEFRIRAGIRDHIRQLILENMLDDRHDLTGNSIYGLKFDTTVLPGPNTYRRAFVRVAITIHDPFLDSKPGEEVPEVLKLYYDNPSDSIEDNPSEKIRESFRLYDKWLKNVQLRLYEYTQSAYYKRPYSFRTDCKIEEINTDTSEFTRDILASVLNIDLGGSRTLGWPGKDPTSIILSLPEQWSRLLTIERFGGTCEDKIHNYALDITFRRP